VEIEFYEYIVSISLLFRLFERFYVYVSKTRNRYEIRMAFNSGTSETDYLEQSYIQNIRRDIVVERFQILCCRMCIETVDHDNTGGFSMRWHYDM